MTPLECYHEEYKKGSIVKDPLQLKVLTHLEKIYFELIEEQTKRSSRITSLFRYPKLIKGAYIYGGVGIGKTFLMDCFYNSLPFKNKMRMHFHKFMQRIHDSLAKYQGRKDPLLLIAKELSKETIILCFDEFFVSDITDAMLLGRLFHALFFYKVSLVTTSNIAPDELYKSGLQREQFLPAIALIKSNTEIIPIQTKKDYRLRHLKEAGVFYTPLDDNAKKKMEKSFSLLTEGKEILTSPVMICDRPIQVIKHAGDVIWFEFSVLCHVPRSQKDYLAIAATYRTVFISNIPSIRENDKDTICLFISMIDVFYDAKIRLVISSEESVQNIYSRGYMILEYTRAHSRLLEMQSVDYFTGEFNDNR